MRKMFFKTFWLLSSLSFLILPFSKSFFNNDIMIRDKLMNELKFSNLNNAIFSQLTSSDLAEISLKEINSCVETQDNFYSIKNFFDVTDLIGNEYTFTIFNPYGFSVISKETLETVEIDPFITDIYEYSDIYMPVIGLLKDNGDSYQNFSKTYSISKSYLNVYGENLRERFLFSNKMENLEKKLELYSSQGGETGNTPSSTVIDVDNQIVNAQEQIEHSWFFKHNKTQFSYHSGGENGICEYVAFLLLCEYNDFFKAKGYFSDEEIESYVTTVPFGYDYISAIPTVSDDFVYDLFIKNKRKESLFINDLNSLADLFLSSKNIEYSTSSALFGTGNPRDVIKKGYPDMICGLLPKLTDTGEEDWHNIIAYGYFSSGTYEGKYLTHYGWNNRSQVIISLPFYMLYDWSLRDNTKNPERRYIFNIYNTMRCGEDCTYG